MKERIQKILAAHGLASRRQAEELIRQGRVRVNGCVASVGDSADAALDAITVDGAALRRKDAPVCLMLYKPRGYVTTMQDERGRKTAASLVDCGCRVYPVGRLDCASEGLLLFTNDGDLTNRLLHPKNLVEKTYEVTVSGALSGAAERLARPIVLDGRPIRPPRLRLVREHGEKQTYEITITEGRNRQIRRMCEAAGLRVLRLCRVQEGPLRLGSLPVGKWRYLTQQELAALYAEVGK